MFTDTNVRRTFSCQMSCLLKYDISQLSPDKLHVKNPVINKDDIELGAYI